MVELTKHILKITILLNLRTCLHKHMRTSFRQILLHTALKVLAVRQHACGFWPCLQQNYARKSAHISYEDRFWNHCMNPNKFCSVRIKDFINVQIFLINRILVRPTGITFVRYALLNMLICIFFDKFP